MMKQNNDVSVIRSGLVNYIGALITTLSLEPQKAKHIITSILAEEALKLCQKEDDTNDFFASKPLLRAVTVILEQRNKELSLLDEKNESVYNNIAINKDTIKHLKFLCETVKENV